MHEKKFVEAHVKTFSQHIGDSDIALVGYTGASLKFILQNKDYLYPVTFTISYELFMQEIGCYCLVENHYVYTNENFIEYKIENSVDNFYALYNRIKPTINEIGLDIEIDNNTGDYYFKLLPVPIESKSKWSNRIRISETLYSKMAPTFIFRYCEPILFQSDEKISARFSQTLIKLSKKNDLMTEESKSRYSELAAGAASLQKQREFINY